MCYYSIYVIINSNKKVKKLLKRQVKLKFCSFVLETYYQIKFNLDT